MAEREARLDAIREEARDHGQTDAPGSPIAGGPIPAPSTGYYGQPVLKAPVWTWEIPAYFAVGGLGGMAAALAAVAEFTGADPALAADARLVAFAGAAVSPLLLISDLGRPARFLNMLRVFKLRSPMSVGAWTLVAFTGATFAAYLLGAPQASPALAAVRLTTIALAALFGLVLSTYTGVLLGVSALPVWAAHARLLPIHFAGSSLGAAAGVLELVGHRQPALNVIAIGAAGIVLACALLTERDRRAASQPLSWGRSGMMVRIGDALAGALVLLLRLILSGSLTARLIAAAAAIAGSFCSRFGWIAAGRASAEDPRVILDEGPR